jgi:hypothetical protein
MVCRLARAPGVRATRHGGALASPGLASVLALEVPLPRRASSSQPEVQELIATLSRENRLWGTERIRGELLKLGIVVSNRSIRRYRWRGPRRPSSQTWRTFLANHASHLWVCGLITSAPGPVQPHRGCENGHSRSGS